MAVRFDPSRGVGARDATSHAPLAQAGGGGGTLARETLLFTWPVQESVAMTAKSVLGRGGIGVVKFRASAAAGDLTIG